MRSMVSRILLAAGICLGLALQSAHAAPPATDIELLPPTDPNSSPVNQPCAVTGTNGVLVMHNTGAGGTSAINCNTKVTADPATGDIAASGAISATGQVSAGTLSLTTNTLGALDYHDSDLLKELYAAPACATNQALVKNATGFGCVNIIDLTDIGTFPVPTCAAGSALTWTGAGTGFACIGMPVVPPANPPIGAVDCTATGQVVIGFNASGQPMCGNYDFPSCTAGQSIVYNSSGVPVCTSGQTVFTASTGPITSTATENAVIANVASTEDATDAAALETACDWTGDTTADQAQYEEVEAAPQCLEHLSFRFAHI